MARRSGRKPKTAAERSAVSAKISKLAHEGYQNGPQRVAIALSELRRGGLKRLRKNSGRKKRAA